MSSSDSIELARLEYEAAKVQFERGQYRDAVVRLEKASALCERATPLGGDIQIWLVTAYQAVGDDKSAIALCRKLNQHPHISTRQQSRRLLAILEAPRLTTRPEWNVTIPDLSGADKSLDRDRKGTNARSPRRKPRPLPKPPPIDPSEIERGDNRFIGFGIAISLLILSSLLWLSR